VPILDALHHAAPSSTCSEARARSFEVESTSRSRSLVEHDLFGKPASTFPDHASASDSTNKILRIPSADGVTLPPEVKGPTYAGPLNLLLLLALGVSLLAMLASVLRVLLSTA
jgi:hypothetical protein